VFAGEPYESSVTCAHEGGKPNFWTFKAGSPAEYCMHVILNSMMSTLDPLCRQSHRHIRFRPGHFQHALPSISLLCYFGSLMSITS
jgi:hypothetical protein